MKYYRRGRIVLTNDGYICRVLARPGQLVFKNNKITYLKDKQYIIYNKDIGITNEYIVVSNTEIPTKGFLITEDQIYLASEYERFLRRRGTSKSPFFDTSKPKMYVGEIVVFNKLLYPFKKPKIDKIVGVESINDSPTYILLNNNIVKRHTLMLFYRKLTYQEKEIFKRDINKIQ